MPAIEPMMLVAGILLLAGVVASKLSDRLGVPALLLFLLVGMIAGSEGIGGIEFDSPEIAQAVGTTALLIILFAGGLDTNWSAVRPVVGPGLVLSTVGVLSTTLLLGAFTWFMLGSYSSFDIGTRGITWIEAMLLAAIVSSTDAAAVFSVFRTSDIQPKSKIRYLLEFESGSNDPMAVLLTTAILGVMAHGEGSFVQVAFTLVRELVLGGAIGCALGFAGAWIMNRLRLSAPGLYPMLVLSLGLVTFGLAYVLGGNGFLAVYAAGVVIGNRVVKNRESVLSFHDGLSWLAQIAMFIVLGLLVFPSRLLSVAGVSIAMALFLMFVARPLSVAACLLPFRPRKNELAYISWVGLRGSVPIVLATFPATYGIEGADEVFNVIFFIVLTSVLVQGLSLIPCARWFGVTADETQSDENSKE